MSPAQATRRRRVSGERTNRPATLRAAARGAAPRMKPAVLIALGVRAAAPALPEALAAARNAFGGRRIVARLTGLSERTLASLETLGQPCSAANRRRVNELERLRSALLEIMQPDFIRTWMDAPNERLTGRTPLETVERGEADRLWALIERVRSGEAT